MTVPTHATENLLAMFAAVEAALGALPELEGRTAAELAEIRADFLTELNKRAHVVGHATDRHHELQRRCAELIQVWDSTGTLDDTLLGVEAMEAIREVVAHPLHNPPPPQTRLGQASAEAFDRFAGQLEGPADA